jgi:hypothetical protein
MTISFYSEGRFRSIELKQLHDRIISLRGSMFGSVRLKQLHDRIISLRGKVKVHETKAIT